MSTVIPQENILDFNIASLLSKRINHFDNKKLSINFEINKLFINFSYKDKIDDLNYYVCTKFIFKNINDLDITFDLIEFDIIDNQIDNRKDKYFIFIHNDSMEDLKRSSDYFKQVLEKNKSISLEIANEFFTKNNDTNTQSLIQKLLKKFNKSD